MTFGRLEAPAGRTQKSNSSLQSNDALSRESCRRAYYFVPFRRPRPPTDSTFRDKLAPPAPLEPSEMAHRTCPNRTVSLRAVFRERRLMSVLPDVSHVAGSVRILVADADDDTRSLYREALTHAGCEVIAAADGRDALVEALARRPTLVVTETRLPVVDGYGLCEVLRRDPLTRTVPILVVTTDTRDVEMKRARVAGADAVLNKPVTPDVLLCEIQRLLGDGADTRRESGRQPPPQAEGHLRAETRASSSPTTDLFCPFCDHPLQYERSDSGGVKKPPGAVGHVRLSAVLRDVRVSAAHRQTSSRQLKPSRQFNERDDRNVVRSRVTFELRGHVAVAVEIQHDDVGLQPEGLGERRIRVGFGDAQARIGEMLDVGFVGQAVVDEHHGRRWASSLIHRTFLCLDRSGDAGPPTCPPVAGGVDAALW